MFVRCKSIREHRYWSVAENVRVRGGRVVQRHALYLGEINDSQRAAWCRSVEVLALASRGLGRWRCFPRPGGAVACEVGGSP